LLRAFALSAMLLALDKITDGPPVADESIEERLFGPTETLMPGLEHAA